MKYSSIVDLLAEGRKGEAILALFPFWHKMDSSQENYKTRASKQALWLEYERQPVVLTVVCAASGSTYLRPQP